MSRHQPIWIVRAEYRTTLPPSLLNRLISGEGVKRALVRRVLASRTVTFLEPASPDLPPLYLKEYRPRTVASLVKYLFRSPADREWHAALRVAGRGIATFVPLAVGNLRRFGLLTASYLITRRIDRARPLKDYLTEHRLMDVPQNKTERQQIFSSLACFVRELHRKGILHLDFHWGNILIDADNGDTIRWYLMDLHRVKLRKSLYAGQRINNLAALNTAFLHTTRRTERLRFLKAYAQGDQHWEKRLHHFAPLIEKKTREMGRQGWHRQGRRCLKDNKYFLSFSCPSCRGYIRRDISSPRFLELLQDPGSAFTCPGSVVIKDSKTTSCCTLPVETAGGTQEVFVKRYNYQNAFYAFKYLFRRSRGKRTWKAAHALLARDIPAPLPLAYLDHRRRGVLRESFFITEQVAHAMPLRRLLLDAAAGVTPVQGSERRSLIDRAAALIRLMHERGIWHRDLKATNILVQRLADSAVKLYITDLDSTRIKDRLMTEERIRDLARLNISLAELPRVSACDRLRFLHAYLNIRSARDKTLRAYWQAIGRKTAKKLAKNIQEL